MKTLKNSRRNFLKKTVVAASAITIVPRHVLGGRGFIAPSDKVNVALVGAGGRGNNNLKELFKLEDVQVTAMADPAEYWDLANFYYRTTAGRGPVKKRIEDHYQGQSANFKVAEYLDFREMLQKESSLDAVLCATPDHTHAYICLQSFSAGKHVYCEKPLTHNIWEAREVKRVAAESGLATQMGNQQHSSVGIRQTVEYLRAGVLGNITEAHAWVTATRWIPGLKGVPEGSTPLPNGLDWDLWLGPRSKRDFHEAYVPVTWRDFWDFGCGAMGDFGCHDLDAAVWGLELPLPETVEMFPAGFSNEHITPYGEIGYFHFPATDKNEPLKLTWYSGGLRPPRPELLPDSKDLSSRGALYVGEKGIMVYEGRGQAPKLYPESLEATAKELKPTLPPTNGHHRDWIDAIKDGPKASSHFEYGAHLTEITLLGVLSLRLGGQKIYWDAENMKAVGIPKADKYIQEKVRGGWKM